MSHPIVSSSSVVVHRAGLLALGLSTLLPMLAGSMANMALPALGQAFAIPFASLRWVLVAYLLGLTSLTLVAGRLGDRFGRRRLLLWGLVLFVLASLLCALAPGSGWLGFGWLLAARVLQGVGAACMLALALALMGQLVPPARRGRAMGLLGTLSACGTALGPSFGGLLIDPLGWQVPFLLLVPLGLLTLGAALIGLPEDGPGRKDEGINPGSLLALMTALLCYGVLLSVGSEYGYGLVSIGGVAVWLLVRSERHANTPLLPLTLLHEPALRGGLLGSALVVSVMVLTLLIGPFYLRGVFGLSLTEVGLWISGGPLLAACTGLPAGWLVDRIGSTLVVRLGLGVMLIATLGLVASPISWGPLGYLLPILLLTAGYALFQTANNSAVVGAANEQHRGAVAGLLTLSRNLGQLTGVAGLGGLFVWLAGGGDEAALTRAMEGTFALTLLPILLALVLAGAGGRRVTHKGE